MSFAQSFRLRVLRPLLPVPLLGGLALCAALAAAGFSQAPKAPSGPATAPRGRVLLVTRHCEKDPSGDPRDPGLSEIGKARARALHDLLARQSIDAAFTSEYKRAAETAAITIAGDKAGAKGSSTSQVVKASEPDRLFAAIDALQPGQTALVVGHSNTAPAVLAHYGVVLHDGQGKPIANLPESEYGSLFVVTLPPAGSGAAASMIELHYGN